MHFKRSFLLIEASFFLAIFQDKTKTKVLPLVNRPKKCLDSVKLPKYGGEMFLLNRIASYQCVNEKCDRVNGS